MMLTSTHSLNTMKKTIQEYQTWLWRIKAQGLTRNREDVGHVADELAKVLRKFESRRKGRKQSRGQTGG